MKKIILLTVIGLTQSSFIFAATPINLNEKPIAYLQRFMPQQQAHYLASNQTTLDEVQRSHDQKENLHIRLQQKYQGLPIWHAQAIVHMPATSSKNLSFAVRNNEHASFMSGKLFEGVASDLASINIRVLNDTQKNKAIAIFQQHYHRLFSETTLTQYQQASSSAMVYFDQQQRARYGILVSFYYDDQHGARRPSAIVDAERLSIVKMWDQISHQFEKVPDKLQPIIAGGIGGNGNTGNFMYDGGQGRGHRKTLPMSVQHATFKFKDTEIPIQLCYLKDAEVVVYDLPYNRIASGVCTSDPRIHHNIPWLTSDGSPYWTEDSANGARSPSLDAYYAAHVVKAMYQDWYQIPVLKDQTGKSILLEVRTHYGRDYANAYWDPVQKNMTFGDGNDVMYPLTLLGVMAHEVSHGFTNQHAGFDKSNLQSAALSESFSDMADKAVEYYHDQTVIWKIGHDVFKDKERVARYMDDPTKDHMSIAHMKDYKESDNPFEDPHLRAGIFNKAFYLLATSQGWNVRKAFDVMVQANRFYWTAGDKFKEAACGAVYASLDLGYPVSTVKLAFSKVGLDTDNCTRRRS